MTVGIFSGKEGVGKTTQLLILARAYPKVFWIVMELKDKKRLEKEVDKDFELSVVYKTYPKGHKHAMQIDSVATLKTISEARDHVLETHPETVVIDGISDLRDLATIAWAEEYNEANGTKLTTPKYKDWGEWGKINQKVRDILEPLINFALTEDTDLWMTAQMKDDYVNDVKVGTKPDLKEWMSYPVQCLFELERTKSGYSLICTKEPENAAWERPELEKDIGVLRALIEHGLAERTESVLEQVAEQKKYMVVYGDHKKMFITATSKVKAAEKFEAETYGKIETYEVLE